ncbi:uncharacterized protein TrAtP1_005354 [Trichoderma atroviride]|uniref:uncharacterized protein n=1 Tax=Hypocrea atroviridis TaxID=63577 RepID=UPI00331EDF0F|nr:hypothetical protein TrAtP1_005354 [Trichoderma atroviride]
MAGGLRCSLCQFVISDEDIITGDDETKYGGMICPSPTYSYFKSIWELHCLRRCHRQCLNMISPRYLKCLWDMTDASKYDYMPSARQLDIRQRKIKSLMGTELLTHFAHSKSNLPLELWEIVAEYLLPHFTTANLQSLWEPTPKPCYANMTQPIWCKYVEFEGNQYVSTFSNEPKSDDWELVFQPSNAGIVDVYAAENHFGITKLLFSSPHNLPKVDEVEGIWWRKSRIDEESLNIRASSDGIKLRRLMGVEEDDTAWSVPKSNSVRFEHFTPSHLVKLPDRMASLVINHPSIVGYSILWDIGLTKFYAHRRGEAGFRYQSSPYKSWLHMPIDPGEVITEVWLRQSLSRRERALGIKTSTGRVFIAGVYSGRCTNWSLVGRPGQTAEVFLDCSGTELMSLAFESDKPAPPRISTSYTQTIRGYISFRHRRLLLLGPRLDWSSECYSL